MATLDLFARLVSVEAENANFRGIRDYSSPEAKAVLTAWSEGFVDRDGKFLIELQTTFNSSFWELYLHAALKEMAFDVNFDHPRPDFLVCRDGKPQFTVEAAIASNASGASKEWDRPMFNPKDWLKVDVEAVVDAATLRFSNTVVSKYAKYEREYSTLAHVQGLPFVLGIAAFDQPFFFYESIAPALRVLYGYDMLRDVRTEGAESSFPDAQKPGGAIVPMGLFLREQLPHVSAVLFSNVATASKLRALCPTSQGETIRFFVLWAPADGGPAERQSVPGHEYSERLLDGLHVFHNPAVVQFPQATFDRPGEVQWGYDSKTAVSRGRAAILTSTPCVHHAPR